MTTEEHEADLSDGWIVELTGAGSSALYLTVSTTNSRFGWTPDPDHALALARRKDANALARYAQARIPEGATAISRQATWNRELTDYERENDRLRARIRNLESILSSLRRIREAAVGQALEDSQKGIDQ